MTWGHVYVETWWKHVQFLYLRDAGLRTCHMTLSCGLEEWQDYGAEMPPFWAAWVLWGIDGGVWVPNRCLEWYQLHICVFHTSSGSSSVPQVSFPLSPCHSAQDAGYLFIFCCSHSFWKSLQMLRASWIVTLFAFLLFFPTPFPAAGMTWCPLDFLARYSCHTSHTFDVWLYSLAVPDKALILVFSCGVCVPPIPCHSQGTSVL